MSWFIDRAERRVINEQLGISLVEGKGRDGDIEYALLDRSGATVTNFYSRSDTRNAEHNKSAPSATNYSAIVTVFGLFLLRKKESITINNQKFMISEVLLFIRDALTHVVGGYDLGFPKHLAFVFEDSWLS